ncbi:hypothetical protein ANTPLA_LOCUS9103 [Anthophora plagiata]
MPLHYVKNPMYALCLLAAVCVRQHVQNGRDSLLTKNISFQPPTSVLTKPSEEGLKSAINAYRKSEKKTADRTNLKVEDTDSLVQCVKNFANRARRIVNDIRDSIPNAKTLDHVDPLASSGILDSLLYITSSIGIKWLA